MVPRERQREEMASDYYYGGMVINRTGKIQPALYHRGLMDAARRHGATLVGHTRAGKLTKLADGWRVETNRGLVGAREVVIATNGYTGSLTPDLKRRLIPIASHIIATEALDPGLAASLIPKGRTLADSRRILCYYRMSPDGTRVIFGGPRPLHPGYAGRGGAAAACDDAATLATAAGHARDARLDRQRRLRFRLPAAYGPDRAGSALRHGCNGSGVAILSYLGAEVGKKILGQTNRVPSFDGQEFPTRSFYTGNPWMLPAVGNWYRFRDWLDRTLA